jgi:integrase
MRERGLSPGGINVRLRSINSFLTWLREEGHISERLRMKLLKNPPKPIQTLTDQDVKRLVTYRPTGRIETRTWTLALVLLDCGLRISEALGLERDDVDLDGLVLRVTGKGSKVRLVPISNELRKHLFRYLDKTSGRYVFHNRGYCASVSRINGRYGSSKVVRQVPRRTPCVSWAIAARTVSWWTPRAAAMVPTFQCSP